MWDVKAALPTPVEIRSIGFAHNIQNKDLRGFLYCIAASYRTPKWNPRRPNFYNLMSERFNLEGITIPVKIEDIPRFEKQNNLCVNVFKFSKDSAHGPKPQVPEVCNKIPDLQSMEVASTSTSQSQREAKQLLSETVNNVRFTESESDSDVATEEKPSDSAAAGPSRNQALPQPHIQVATMPTRSSAQKGAKPSSSERL